MSFYLERNRKNGAMLVYNLVQKNATKNKINKVMNTTIQNVESEIITKDVNATTIINEENNKNFNDKYEKIIDKYKKDFEETNKKAEDAMKMAIDAKNKADDYNVIIEQASQIIKKLESNV
jgi:hypothetical protein